MAGMVRALRALPLLLALSAHAKTTLTLLPPDVLGRLTPFLERGELSLIESKKDGSLRQITMMTVVDAPPAAVYSVVATPDRYPEFVPNMSKSRVTRRGRGVALVDWELEVPLNNLEGTNIYRFGQDYIDIEAVSGDLPEGHWRWEIHPTPGGRSVVVVYVYTDVRRASWIMRQLVKRHRSAEHASVLSAATVFMKSLKLRAEKLVGRGRGLRPDPRGRRVVELHGLLDPAARLDMRALDPLLARGTVALVESLPDGRLQQASIFAYVYTGRDRVFSVAADPGRYREFMSSVKESRVLKNEGRSIVYQLEVEVPLLNLNFTARATQTAPYSLRSRSIGGDLEDARFGWDMEAVRPDRTLVLYYVNSDARRTSWLLRRMIQREPYYEHGFNVATGLVTVRAVRARAEGWW
jgi:ribosome-associated toxin RatA of RatAB toxin-antitoxin module